MLKYFENDHIYTETERPIVIMIKLLTLLNIKVVCNVNHIPKI